MHDLLTDLALILALAVGAQILATRLRLPSILVLLVAGFTAGNTGLIDPGAIDADVLLPLVALAVGLILFEGGLTLDLRDLRADAPRVVLRLLTVGVLLTWLVGAVAAHLILDLSWSISLLLGAVLVVTGPTVVLPLLKHLHLGGRVESILRWEGIVVDPIGALLAVLVFQAVRAGQRPTLPEALAEFVATTAVGAIVGIVAAGVLILLVRRARLGDNQEVVATLALVVAAVATANTLAHESGLMAATAMGIAVANVERARVHHIRVFKESIGLLLTGVLFIVLAGRVEWAEIRAVGWEALGMVAVLVLVARPLATLLATWGSTLERRETAMLAWMAPRGIVAAAVASIFAVDLTEGETPIAGAELLAPVTFVVIVATVAVYGLSAGWLARAMGLLHSGPPRVLLAGAHAWGRSIAAELKRHDIPVRLWATRPENEQLARQAQLAVRGGDLLHERPAEGEEADIAVLMTDNSEFNALAAMHLREHVAPGGIHQLGAARPGSQRAPAAFDPAMTFDRLDEWFAAGATVRSRRVEEDDGYAPGPDAVPLFVVTPGRAVRVVRERGEVGAKPGQVVIALERAVTRVTPDDAPAEGEEQQ